MDNIAVSIICNTFNHGAYIREALDGFLMQKTDFEYEILVHDDASTDNTADIIREYEAKYPELIKPVYQTENQWSKGQGLVGKLQRERARGRYIALCEGDDYWTDPLKLQKQYDALEAHPELDICTHKAVATDAVSGRIVKYIAPSAQSGILTTEQIIAGGGEYVATNSIMYRKSINDNIPEFRRIFRFDYALQIHAGLRGGMIYLAECMSAYRVMTPNSWTASTYANADRLVRHLDKLISFLNILNGETEYKYDNVIKKAILEQEFYSLKAQKRFRELKEGRFRSVYKKHGLIERCYITIGILCPGAIRLKDRLKKR